MSAGVLEAEPVPLAQESSSTASADRKQAILAAAQSLHKEAAKGRKPSREEVLPRFMPEPSSPFFLPLVGMLWTQDLISSVDSAQSALEGVQRAAMHLSGSVASIPGGKHLRKQAFDCARRAITDFIALVGLVRTQLH